MKALLALACCAALAGCAHVDLSNRVACTVAGDQALMVSQYGAWGVSSKVHAADAAAICARHPPAPSGAGQGQAR